MNTQRALLALGVVGIFQAASALAQPEDSVSVPEDIAYSAFADDPLRQFDFLGGQWRIKGWTAGSEDHPRKALIGRSNAYLILHGRAMLELASPDPSVTPFVGAGSRVNLVYYDGHKGNWKIRQFSPDWGHNQAVTFEGRFKHGRGVFVRDEPNGNSEPVQHRWLISDITPFSMLQQQLTSGDGGLHWRVRQGLEYTRISSDPDWPLESLYFPTYGSGTLCTQVRGTPFTALAGHWHGRINRTRASISSWLALEGCALLVFLDIESRPPRKRFMLIVQHPAPHPTTPSATLAATQSTTKSWEVYFLDDAPGHNPVQFSSTQDWTELTSGGNSLSWQLQRDTLDFAFGGSDGNPESGRFERQELVGH